MMENPGNILLFHVFKIDPCAWVECVNPPLPEGRHLRYNSDGYPVPFWTNVTYECQPGYFFRHDKEQRSFAVTCRDNGYFFEPSPWPTCIRGELPCPHLSHESHHQQI